MGTPWDRAAAGYVEQWAPRFTPYHLDLIEELALRPGQRVLVVSAGPGAEVLAAARIVGETGRVHARDSSVEMVRLCAESALAARFVNVECRAADATDAHGGPWDAVVCAFGLWQIADPGAALAAWRGSLAANGKIGILAWGPLEPNDPFELLARALREVEPSQAPRGPASAAERAQMGEMFASAGLSMVRHTLVRHVMAFPSAERLVRALREGCTWRRAWEEIGDERMGRVAARFYEWVGGPDVPLSFSPPATLAIATHLDGRARPSEGAP